MQQRPDFHGQIYVWFSNWDQIKMLEIRLSDGVLVEDLDPVLLNYTAEGKLRIEEKYRGNIRGAEFSVKETGTTYLVFFSTIETVSLKALLSLDLKVII
jgi:hypothetical protein